MPGFTVCGFMLCPLLPRVIGEGILAIGRAEWRELAALLLREARADADVLQRARIVKKAEQQGADIRAISFLVPSKTGNDAVAIALVLATASLPVFDGT